MNFGKMPKTAVSFLLIVISLAVLIIPPTAISYAETLTIQNIMDVQGDYANGTFINTIEPVNETEMGWDPWSIVTTIGDDVNNDTVFYGYRLTAPAMTKRSAYWGDYQTYLGNGTYEMNVNYSHVPDDNYTNRQLIIELDMTTTEWSTYDFIKIHNTNLEWSMYLYYQDSTTNSFTLYEPEKLSATEYIAINTFAIRASMADNGKVYLVFYDTVADIDPTTFEFQLQAFNLIPADALSWTEDQMYVLTLLGCDIILIIGFVFTTNFVDVFIDHSNAKKSRKSKRRDRR